MRALKAGSPKTKKLVGLILGIYILASIGLVAWFKVSNGNPLPAGIRSQIGFKFVYPRAGVAAIDASSYDYQAQSSVLHFTVNFAGAHIIFSEQPVPDKLGSDTEVYFPTLGIHPYAQFKTARGLVALTKFWQSGSLQPYGQAAVIVSNGTLTIAHTDKNLTNQQWKSLFDSLKIAQ